MPNADEVTTIRGLARGGSSVSGEEPEARLVVLVGTDAGRSFTITRSAIIGRGRDVEVPLSGEDVSRHHARLERLDSGEYMLTDLGSSNGTLVNGEKIDQRRLQYGDKIAMGGTTGLLFTRRDPAEDQALQSQKLESIGQLAGGIAHDFNNLLTAVLTNIEFVRTVEPDTTLDENEIRDALEDAERAVRRAIELTAQLKRFSQRDHTSSRPVDLTEVAGEALQLVRRTFDRSISLESDLRPKMMVLGDHSQLMQVVMNLLINARDAMPDGGELRVSVKPVPGRSRPAPVPGLEIQGDSVGLYVQDTGIGMDEKTQARMFEPFFTTKGAGAGTGLGLATVYGIVRAHGGEVEVESEAGLGTTFRVHLPRAEPVEIDDRQLRRPTLVSNAPGRTVLLVEDEEVIRTSCARLLKNRGFTVFHAGDGLAGLKVYEENRREIDVVLLDLIMPVMGGEEAFHALKSRDPNLPVVLTSGHGDRTDIEALMGQGAAGFLEKPYDVQHLVDILSAAIIESASR